MIKKQVIIKYSGSKTGRKTMQKKKKYQRHEEKSNIHIIGGPRWKGERIKLGKKKKRIKLKQHLKEYV